MLLNHQQEEDVDIILLFLTQHYVIAFIAVFVIASQIGCMS